MKIKKIVIEGIKNIQKCELEFNGLTALVSFNNYGKSNVLNAIKFANQFIAALPALKKNLMGNTNFVPINNITATSDFKFYIEYSDNINGESYDISYNYSFEWIKDDSSGQKILTEMLKFKKSLEPQYSSYMVRENEKGKYRTALTGRANKDIFIDENELLINKLSNYDELFYIGVINSILRLDFSINTFYDASTAFNFNPILAGDIIEDDFHISIENDISKLFYTMKNKYPSKYELVKNTFIDIFPQIDYIEPLSQPLNLKVKSSPNTPFTFKDTIYTIFVKEKHNNQPLPFEYLSKGTQRVFVTLVSAALSSLGNIALIAFEELENCVHPKLFQRLLDVLTQMAEDTNMVITSHSPYMLQYLPLNNIYLGVPNKDNLAIFKKIRPIKQRGIMSEASSAGVSTGEYLFDFLIECEEDEELITEYFGE
jgi:predicted ATPase